MFNRTYRLRTLMLALSVGGILLTSMLLLGALTLFQTGNIEESLLESNIAYARKLADTTDHYLATAKRELAYSASLIKSVEDTKRLKYETDRLRLQSGFFNSVAVVSAGAMIVATSPESPSLTGRRLTSVPNQQALNKKQPFISAPFVSAAGNYLVFLSQPLFSVEGKYIGYLGGTLHLKKQSMLSEILGQHFYDNQTQISVVTGEGRIIFSHDPTLVGTTLSAEPALMESVVHARSGGVIDRNNVAADLIGFASLNQADWHVLIAGTSESVSTILLRSAINAGWFILAIIALTVAIVTYFAARLSAPLEKLAKFTRTNDSESALRQLNRLRPGYDEAERLREAVSHHLQRMTRRVNKLSDEAMKDPLTGLFNRKGFRLRVSEHRDARQHCVIAIDIDYFKKINDRYGHDGGDAVLIALGKKLRHCSRDADIVCRAGGEEFIIFLPETSREVAASVAEQIRDSVESATFPPAGHVTLCAGVAALSDCDNDLTLALRRADLALYEAKKAGRNAVIISTPAGMTGVVQYES
ncbi:sensor domain-containing diguanylate cyclase [Yokenella regensburgei]|uniref:sensor domain-containing diguanylate cyclase n=1 Tax=Yokenella regensburgei TaxID=158877 RepID=UPI003F167759